MKDLSLGPLGIWNAVFALSLVAIVGAFAFDRYVPKTVVDYHPAKVSPGEVDRANQVAKDSKDRVDSKLWNLDAEELGGSVLSYVTTKAEKSKVQIVDFRGEKPSIVSELSEARFLAVLDGDFKDVMTVVGKLESPDSKLGVGMCQLATSDRGTGFVKATLSLTAFQKGGPSYPHNL